MKLVFALVLVFTVSQGKGYVFPMCNLKNDKSCIKFSGLTSFKFWQNDEAIIEKQDIFVEAPKVIFTVPKFLNIFDYDALQTKLDYTYNQYFLGWLYALLKYIPFLNFEEKAKYDSKLFLLFIFNNLVIYLALYFYFAKKLSQYYREVVHRRLYEKIKNALTFKPQ